MKLPKPKYLLLSLLVFSRWVVYGFTDIALIAILRQEGATLAQVSMLIAVGFFFLFKFLWAPIVDRYRVGRSHYKSWILVTQALLAMGLLPLLLIQPKQDFNLLFAFLATASLAATFRDIAMDGLGVKILTTDERAEANGYMSAGFMLGMVVGGGFVLIGYDTIGWFGSIGVLVAATLIPIPILWFYREPVADTTNNHANHSLFSGLTGFFREPGNLTWAILVVLIAGAGTMGNGLISVVLVDMKWTLAELGWVMNVIAPLVSAAASVGAGLLFARMTRKASLVSTLLLVAATGFAFIFALSGTLSFWAVSGLVIVSVVAGVVSNIAAKTAITDKSAKSPENVASYFTIQASLAQVSSIGLGSLAPLLAEEFGYPIVFAISAGIAVVAAIALARYKHI
jgi:MFS transporter, PAT family, beta-lactamase induction signal transducer AmpG